MAVQTMAHGTRAGLLSSFAFHLASYLHIIAAAFGVTVLLNTAPFLLVVLKVVGGGYLIWMGLRLWRRPHANVQTDQSFEETSSRRAFRDSLIVEFMNPKSTLFYFAFLPQFTTPEAAFPIWAQVVSLGVIANITFSISDVLCIGVARFVAVQTAWAGHHFAWGRRIAGTILIAMGARTLADAR